MYLNPKFLELVWENTAKEIEKIHDENEVVKFKQTRDVIGNGVWLFYTVKTSNYAECLQITFIRNKEVCVKLALNKECIEQLENIPNY